MDFIRVHPAYLRFVFQLKATGAAELLQFLKYRSPATLECSPKTEPGVMRESGAERRRNSHETEKTHTGRSHQKAA